MELAASGPLRVAGSISIPAAVIRYAPLLLLAAMAVFFGAWYGHVLYQLPLYGDSAEHARISRTFLDGGFLDKSSPYPPLYHLLGALGLSVGGEDGFITVTVVSTALLGVAAYFLAREISGSTAIALVAAFMAWASPKTPFYAGRFYMEIMLTVLVLVSLAFFVRYMQSRRMSDLILCAISCGLASATKQQGLLLVSLPILTFLAGYEVFHWWRQGVKPRFRHLGIFSAVLLVLVGPVLAWQLWNTGAFIPETEFTSWMNDVGATVIGFDGTGPEWRTNWNEELWDSFRANDGERGFQTAEDRHIWPLDVLTSPDAFFSINSLYPHDVARVGEKLPAVPTYVLGALFLGGLALWLKTERRRWLPVFIVLFLALNYVSFVRNTDQWRYHLFIPFILSFVIPFVAFQIGRRFSLRGGYAALAVLVLGLVVYSTQYLEERRDFNLTNWNRQAYAWSAGGMASVSETGEYLNRELAEGESFFAVPATEFRYYADRPGIYDYRLLFLSEARLRQIFSDMRVHFIVVPESMILPDEEWNHIGRVPRSFVAKLDSLYEVSFVTQAGDIRVYEVDP